MTPEEKRERLKNIRPVDQAKLRTSMRAWYKPYLDKLAKFSEVELAAREDKSKKLRASIITRLEANPEKFRTARRALYASHAIRN